MNRFEYILPQLDVGEQQLCRASNVRLYDGDTKTLFEGGDVILTTHRIWWAKPGDIDRGHSCLGLPLFYIVFLEEEIPSAFHFTRSSKIILHLSPPANGRRPGPVPYSSNNYVKLSFKDGLEDSFISVLRSTISQRKWEQENIPPVSPAIGSIKSVPPPIQPRAGICGIERGIQEKHKATEESLSIAFQDLSKLMNMAKDMVSLSKTISSKIRDKTGSITEDETVQFKSYLLSLGIDDPVTRGSYSSESKYINDLAQEIVNILQRPIEELGGMMSLADAYCRVNRARGLELLSPEDLLHASKRLEKLNLPLRLRVFDSGVMVLQLSSHNDEAVVETTVSMIKESGSLTAEELAQSVGISVLLAKERLITTEKHGKACRDESIEGLRFFPNLFLEKEDR